MTIPPDFKVQPLISKGRSQLIFEYYKGDKAHIRILDFFENIAVKESQKSNLISYNPISRAGNLYSYGGAKSRNFSLSFNITLGAVLKVSKDYYIQDRELRDRSEDFFVEEHTTTDDEYYFDQFGKADVSHYDMNFLNLLEEYQPDAVPFMTSDPDRLRAITSIEPGGTRADADAGSFGEIGSDVTMADQRRHIINVIMFWVNMIRSSVVNDAQNPMNGPPIVRLRHGTLYRDVPCVCKSYNIAWDEKAGYDLRTLLPRVIKVGMSLEEYRVSTERDYIYGEMLNRDALAGWEQLMKKPYSMDPGLPSEEDPSLGGP